MATALWESRQLVRQGWFPVATILASERERLDFDVAQREQRGMILSYINPVNDAGSNVDATRRQ